MTENTRKEQIRYHCEMMDELRDLRKHQERYAALCKTTGYDNVMADMDERVNKLIQDTSVEITWVDVPQSQRNEAIE